MKISSRFGRITIVPIRNVLAFVWLEVTLYRFVMIIHHKTIKYRFAEWDSAGAAEIGLLFQRLDFVLLRHLLQACGNHSIVILHPAECFRKRFLIFLGLVQEHSKIPINKSSNRVTTIRTSKLLFFLPLLPL